MNSDDDEIKKPDEILLSNGNQQKSVGFPSS